jgi:integrase/recombinase XerD
MELERGLSLNSVKAYAGDLSEFANYLKCSRTVASWDYAEQADASDYVQFMSAELGYSQASICRKLAAIRMFSRHRAKVSNGTKTDFAELVSGPNVSWQRQTVPKFISVSEVEAMLGIPLLSTPLGLRDRAVLEILYASGLRVSELSNMKMSDLLLDEAVIRIMGKGNKERLVILGKPAIKALKDYLTSGRPAFVNLKTGPQVFLSYRGKPLRPRSIQMIVKESAIKAGVKTWTDESGHKDTEVTPHTLRHSFATHMLQGGADMRVIQEVLGHADISTTEIYAKTNPEMILEAHALHHPRSDFDNHGSTSLNT